jgi:hypothetical protein
MAAFNSLVATESLRAPVLRILAQMLLVELLLNSLPDARQNVIRRSIETTLLSALVNILTERPAGRPIGRR